jgi:murein DD-endopeptidase MepM/ murein hydrolase activator NlpD
MGAAPLLIDGGGKITEPYGPGQPYQQMCPRSANPGIDIAAPCGTTLRAVGYGYVISVGRPCWAGPHAVMIGSGNVWILYAHCSNHYVSPGQQVRPGMAVAAIGSMTGGACCGAKQANPCAASSNCGGVATGPHVHWQVNPAGLAFDSHYCNGLNPVPYLTSWPGKAPSPIAPNPTPPPAIVPGGSGLAAALLVAGGIALVASRG